MSDESGIIGKQRHAPRIPKNFNSLSSKDIWCPLESHHNFEDSDCQRTNVSRDSKISWIFDNKQIRQKNHNLSETDSMILTSGRNWNGYYGSNGKHEEFQKTPKPREISKSYPKTVEDIERWLKTRTDNSPPMDQLKSDGETVDRYLNGDLSSNYLEKDPDALSIDIDLSDKKLILGYDPSYDQFQELQSEKYLEVCEKDGFILPEFQLDNLDPLTLANNDMMVAGEILPSTSTQPDDFPPEPKRSDEILKSLQVNEFILPNLSKSIEKNELSTVNDSVEDLDNVTINLEAVGTPEHQDPPPDPEISQLETTETCKSKLKSRIIKKKRKLLKLDENNMQYDEEGFQTDSKDGIMAVVAISTDKISNMTQIVINTGKEEQIYQGKTSELMEATGYFPTIPKIDGTTAWGRTFKSKESNATNHEVIITNALEELGYTEEGLVSMSLTATENGKTWICPREDCRREFNRLYALKGHLLAHYGVRPFKCDHEGCTWAFHSEFKLKRHKETHLKRKDYVCQVPNCNRRFTTIYNLWTHEKLHSRPNRIACHVPNCAERFQTKRALEIHMKSHDQEHAPYVCTHEGCGKRYYSSNALTSHQRCHSYKEVDIKCGWIGCGKIFDKPCRLKAHVRSHTGAKPYSCAYPGCEWAFSSSSKLKRHEKKHTNERKFQCDFPGCSKAFMRSEHLKEHRLTHKEGRYFQCYLCDARFSAKSSLYVHIKKHQNRENNETGQNGRKLIYMDNSRLEDTESVKILCNELSMELSEISSQNGEGGQKYKFICPVENCKKVYASKSSLRAHTGRVHATGADEVSEKANCPESLDYVFYDVNVEINGNDEIAMAVEEDDETAPGLPEPEPPPMKSILSPIEFQKVKKSHGAARTGLTCLDVWQLKKKINTTLNSVGPSDVVLGTADLGEGLLLTEELPSMYYQDELGTECQILLLDSSTNESTINLRDLE